MKRTIMVWSVIAVIAVGGVISAGYYQNSQRADAQNTIEAKKSDSTPSQDANARRVESDQPGTYVDYQEGLVASTDGIKVLFFHAPWCAQCRLIDADIKKQGVPDGVVIVKVDYDSNQELRKKYGVTLQTTFVKVASDGAEIQKYVAYNEPSFDSVKQNLLAE